MKFFTLIGFITGEAQPTTTFFGFHNSVHLSKVPYQSLLLFHISSLYKGTPLLHHMVIPFLLPLLFPLFFLLTQPCLSIIFSINLQGLSIPKKKVPLPASSMEEESTCGFHSRNPLLCRLNS